MTTETHDTKHTPGPWFARRNSAFWEVVAAYEDRSLNTMPSVAHAWGVGDDISDGASAEANANLIAQAPTLLAERESLLTIQAELVRALEFYARLNIVGAPELGDAARAALALARGGAK